MYLNLRILSFSKRVANSLLFKMLNLKSHYLLFNFDSLSDFSFTKQVKEKNSKYIFHEIINLETFRLTHLKSQSN